MRAAARIVANTNVQLPNDRTIAQRNYIKIGFPNAGEVV